MGYWNTRGLRGSTLEDTINFTNDTYRIKGIAVMQKIPTPITPVELSKDHNKITLAYFDKQSTVDYIGLAQGIAICFDAKETGQKSLPIQNIHEHQMEFMEEFQAQKGVAFLLVHFSVYDEYYFLPFEVLKEYYSASKKGGRKSIPYIAFDKKYLIENKNGTLLNYLDAVNTYLREKG